ncbi:MAG: type III-A CRISPR-associated RAMP protein Csm5 [Acidobacteria bacterium]|nr:type III-A CRISPR-associated RAMP protein Csm5 [Acidobacteriota bacterium]
MSVREIRRYRFKVLTPLHIGNGEKLSSHYDFIVKGDIYFRIDIDRLIENPMQAQALSRSLERKDFKIGFFLAERGIQPEKVSQYTCRLEGGTINKKEVNQHIRDIHHRPFIPGSSIKGAIRTAVFCYLLRRDIGKLKRAIELLSKEDNKRKPKNFDDELMGEVLGKDPHHDLLRLLSVSDSTPFAKEWQAIRKVAVSQLNGKKILDIFVEAVEPKAEGEVEISWNKHLLFRIIQEKKEGKFPLLDGLNGFDGLLSIIRDYSEKLLERERKVYEGGEYSRVRETIDKLLREQKNKEKGFLLPLGWGGGMATKTVLHLIDDLKSLKDLFKRIGRGKPKFTQVGGKVTFPRTRRIAYEGNTLSFPLGWVSFEEVEK